MATANLDDSTQLVALHKQLSGARTELPADRSGRLRELVDQAIDAATRLLWDEGSSDSLEDLISEAVRLTRDVLRRGPESGATGDAPAARDEAEPLGTFVSSCQDLLGGIERQILELEGIEDPAEAIEEITRVTRTIQGECDVLALHLARDLCHRAADLVDDCIEARTVFPAEPILALVDCVGRSNVVRAISSYAHRLEDRVTDLKDQLRSKAAA